MQLRRRFRDRRDRLTGKDEDFHGWAKANIQRKMRKKREVKGRRAHRTN